MTWIVNSLSLQFSHIYIYTLILLSEKIDIDRWPCCVPVPTEKKTIYPAQLMYAAVEIPTTVPEVRITLTEAVPLLATWENFINTDVRAYLYF